MMPSAFIKVAKIKPFLFLWLGQVFSQTALNIMNFALVFRVYETTRSNTAVSFFVLAFGIPAVTLGMVAGVFVDRWDKRLVLVFCNVLRALAVLGFFFSTEAFLYVYVLAFVISCITQFFVPAEAPTIPRVVPPDLLLTANSLFTLTLYASLIFGYVLAGPLLNLFGPKNVFLFISLLFVIASFFVRAVPPPANGRRIIEGIKDMLNIRVAFDGDIFGRVKGDLLEGYKFIKERPIVYQGVTLMTLSQVIISSMAALAPGYADQVLSIKITDASLYILGPAALGLLGGALFVGQLGRLKSKRRLINIGVFSGGLFLFLLSLVYRTHGNTGIFLAIDGFLPGFLKLDILTVAMLLLFLLGVSNAFIDIPSNTLLQENTTEDVRGRVYGVLTASIGAAQIIPTLLAGILADLFGVGRVVLVMAFLIFIYGIYRIASQKVFS